MISIRQHFKQSLASRLMLVFALSAAAIVLLILAIIISGFTSQWKNNVRPHLEQYLDYINDDIGNPPNIERAKKLVLRLPVNIYISGPDINYSSSGSALDLSDIEFESRHRNEGKNDHSFMSSLTKQGQLIAFAESDERMLMRNTFDGYSVYYELYHDGKSAQSHKVRNWALLSLLIIFVLSFWQLRRMLRPVQDIKIGVKQMGEGNLDYRVPIRRDNDLGELAGSINQMAEQITHMLDAKRQLLLAVSHELRAPLTRANIAVQMLEPSTNSRRLEEDLLEMENLVTDILEAERINTPHAVLNRQPLHMQELVAGVIAQFPEHSVQLIVIGDVELPPLELDEKRMQLLLRNLLGNAICHGGESSPVPKVELAINNAELVIKVEDYGRGISREDLAHITEPFYRADISRTRDTGGSGIGLYLCKLIVEAHGGKLEISSELGKGTIITARLPI